MASPAVTILLPNYRTPELTALCLKALRRFTAKEDYRLIAIDNASGDASTELLRQDADLMLIERPASEVTFLPPAEMHATALDLAMQSVDTPFVLCFHTDTIVLASDWLPRLLAEAEPEKVAAVGSWKLERVSSWKRFGKKIEGWFKPPRLAPEDYYPRSHCALFKTAPIRKLELHFFDGFSAGLMLCRNLREAGYELKLLPPEWFDGRLVHLNHATMILHPELGGHKTAKPAARRKLDRELAGIEKKINA